MWKEFKEFALQGNVVDMAVGVIIGSAFGKIVTSLVSDIIMPILGVLTGGISFSNLSFTLTEAVVENGEVIREANTINYGVFLDSILNFLIISFCIFAVIQGMQKAKNKLIKPEEPAKEEPAGPTSEELLAEIRDLLKAEQANQ